MGGNDFYPSRVGYMYGLTDYTYSTFSDYIQHLSNTSVIDSSNTETETIGTEMFNIAGRHVQNAKSSTVKLYIDSWYQDNILHTKYASMLEDAVWCNDRSYESYTSSRGEIYYNGYNRLIQSNDPSLECSRDVDKFTVNEENGNGDLEYPIGLLTADESVYYDFKTIINANYLFWTITPSVVRYYNPTIQEIYTVRMFWSNVNNNVLGANINSNSTFVRPSVSLSNDVLYLSGDGTSDNPFVVIE